jgi:hypothetical protein
MQKPTCSKPYADRHLDCQFAMEDHFVELMEAAAAAGWTASDAAAAVIDLADNYLAAEFLLSRWRLPPDYLLPQKVGGYNLFVGFA